MKLPDLSAIDKFKADTKATIDFFLARKITLPICLSALAHALTKVTPKLAPSEFPALTDLILRFEGPGSERMPQPTKEEIADGLEIFTVHFVEAKDGRPA